MNSVPLGYKLRNGYFEKTVTFVQGHQGGFENYTTVTMVRDSRGRLVSVFQEKRSLMALGHHRAVR